MPRSQRHSHNHSLQIMSNSQSESGALLCCSVAETGHSQYPLLFGIIDWVACAKCWSAYAVAPLCLSAAPRMTFNSVVLVFFCIISLFWLLNVAVLTWQVKPLTLWQTTTISCRDFVDRKCPVSAAVRAMGVGVKYNAAFLSRIDETRRSGWFGDRSVMFYTTISCEN